MPYAPKPWLVAYQATNCILAQAVVLSNSTVLSKLCGRLILPPLRNAWPPVAQAAQDFARLHAIRCPAEGEIALSEKLPADQARAERLAALIVLDAFAASAERITEVLNLCNAVAAADCAAKGVRETARLYVESISQTQDAA